MSVANDVLLGSPYQGYTYAYPHKTAYRPLTEAIPLGDVWVAENRDALFLYVHIPFCEMRCGFCNLFTQAMPKQGIVDAFLRSLSRQAAQVRAALGESAFARLAIGGGTPTFLDVSELETLFDLVECVMGADARAIPTSVETSPGTAEPEKLALLRERGVSRISIGVQSFLEGETAAVARPQKRAEVETALQRLKAARFPTLNIDLMYGLPGQTATSWLESVRAALEYEPEEMYLYPLYVRPFTGMGRAGKAADDEPRLACYRAARDYLSANGYEQISMRLFRRLDAPLDDGPIYCCQDDGMIGLGSGARSYTRTLHYSNEYAVAAKGVREILAGYLARSEESFALADYGFRLSGEEQRRRFILQSLLQKQGLEFGAYTRRFQTTPLEDVPQLGQLEPVGLALRTRQRLRLTAAGLERADAIGPWLYSPRVRRLMEEYLWR